MLVIVRWLKFIAVGSLLSLWLAAANHCRLEQIPVLGFLSCCEEGGSSQDDDCQRDGCASLEDGLYKTEKNLVQVVTPVFVGVEFSVPYGECLDCSHESGRSVPLNFAPPEFPKTWQFSLRAAARPRAPSSFAS